ncbi:hypothetical protein C5167_025221 [Papaver somniferum]|uniref:Pentacotripeptide-repeat region of PRORP domain-containing protein n=1 Tax=Papaver somniferum TaxID=3469 RepID=A0A4Y7JRU3_PAPSO|nr:hypothetical protein C5167_025221 [Papaver somniferum]
MKLGATFLQLDTRAIFSYYRMSLRSYHGSRGGVTKLSSFVRDECKYGRIKKLDDGLKYFNQLISERPLPSIVTFCHILGSLTKIGCYSDVILLYKKMHCFGVNPDIYTLSILINCFCRLGKVDHGFCLLGDILKRGYLPNVITFTTLIKGLCLQEKIDSAYKVFDRMTKTGVRPDAIT